MSSIFRWFRSLYRSLFDRVKLAIQVFRKGLPKVDRETDKAVAELISGRRKPGFPCPRCGTAITVGIRELLANSTVQCSQCGLELKMDWQEDANARRALENLQSAAAEVARARNFKG